MMAKVIPLRVTQRRNIDLRFDINKNVQKNTNTN